MQEIMGNPALGANPASAHCYGRPAREKLEQLRAEVASRFAAEPQEVVFNSGGSEGDTHALVGAARLQGPGTVIAISAIEHEAVVEAAGWLGRLGHDVEILPVDGQGVTDVVAVEALLKDGRPAVVSVMAVNNETGVIQPVAEIARLCRGTNAIFHCDAVRAVGHGFEELQRNCDIHLLNFTGHKFGGPRGVGALVQRGVQLPQLICGGGQESGSRAGTENLAGIAGLFTALGLATPEESQRIEDLRAKLEHELVDRFPGCEIHGKRAARATHITSVSFSPKSGYKLQAALSDLGIAVGTGSACHDSGEVTVSPVLTAMGVDELLARGTLRISLGWNTIWDEIEQLLAALDGLINGPDSEGLNCEI
jgi:cysteine desulfurase